MPVQSRTAPSPATSVEFDERRTASWANRDRRPTHDARALEPESGATELTAADLDELTEYADEDFFAPAEEDAWIGAAVGSYDIVRVLACGGMGVVYLGRHQRLGRKVAIKLPRPYVLRDADLTRRFQSEATAAVQIGHPGVVDVLDYGIASDGTPYLVMELLEGSSLAERMNGEPMPLSFTVRVGARVADTLAAAHRCNVVHRDLKPENVFLQRHRHRPDRCTVKVLDFGFCKLAGGAGLSPMTQQGLILGTPSYMAPEQCIGLSTADHRCDIYALGCVLYELCTGRLPFTGTLEEVRLAMRYRPIVAARWHNRDIPASLDELIMRMLAKNPDERPATMVEVARALERIDLDLSRAARYQRLGSQGG